MLDNGYHISQTGKRIKLTDLPTPHLKNIIKMLERKVWEEGEPNHYDDS